MAYFKQCPECKQDTIFCEENRGFFKFGELGGFWDMLDPLVWVLPIILFGGFLWHALVGYSVIAVDSMLNDNGIICTSKK